MNDMTGGDGISRVPARPGRRPLEELLRHLLGSPADEYRRHADGLRRRTNWERVPDPHKSGEPEEHGHWPGIPL